MFSFDQSDSHPSGLHDYCGCTDDLDGDLAIYIKILLASELSLPHGSFDAHGNLLTPVLVLVDHLLGGVLGLLGNLLGGLRLRGLNVLGLNVGGLLHGLGGLLQGLLTTKRTNPDLLGGLLHVGGLSGGLDVQGLLGAHGAHGSHGGSGGLLGGILGDRGILGGLLGPHGLLGGLLGGGLLGGGHVGEGGGLLGGLLGGGGSGLLGGLLGGGVAVHGGVSSDICLRIGCGSSEL